MTSKKRLFCAIPHDPAFDSCFPLLERLHERGKVEPVILLGPRIRKTDPRVEQAFARKGTPFKPASRLKLEVGAIAEIFRADAVLTHSDPLAYGNGKFRLRDVAVVGLRKPTIFVQHGMVQSGLHEAGNKPLWVFHADLMLLWAQLADPHAPFLDPSVADRIRVTGFIKGNQRGPWPMKEKLRDTLGRHWDQTVLICHNFGFEIGRYSSDMAIAAFSTWAKVAALRPNTLFLLRSHRGKAKPEIAALQSALADQFPNIVLSKRNEGLMQMATINDVLSVVDRVITHPSTVILDSLYQGLPVAIFDGLWSGMESLPRAQTVDQILAYLDHPDPLSLCKALFDTYGDFSHNLDIAADLVEKRLETL